MTFFASPKKSTGAGRALSALLTVFILMLCLAGPLGAVVEPVPLNKEELAFFLGQSWLEQDRVDLLRVSAGQEQSFLIQTTLNPGLQRLLEYKVKRAGAPMVAAAALDPKTGEVKALVSFDHLPGRTNYALTPVFPAASVFKMVTAAAAMEKGGLTPYSTIPFHGGAHTLYRSQIKMPEPKAPRKPTLVDSFAGSINPVFGKLANRPVGPTMLEQFAARFGFDQAINFEAPVSPSKSWVPKDDSYELALSGSGYNRKTTLSPLHGALMAAAVVNGGVMMEPTVVERVMVYQDGRLGAQVYKSKPQVMRRSLSPQTASRMRALMTATITKGTGRRSFRKARTDRVLKNLFLGGKTGSINDTTQSYRIDWFVGYGLEKTTGKALAVGVVVAHDLDRRGIGSRVIARDALRYYFDPSPKPVPVAASAAPASVSQEAAASDSDSSEPEEDPAPAQRIRHKSSSKRPGP